MEELKELVKKYYNFLDVIISDDELENNYIEEISEQNKIYLIENNKLNDYLEKMILSDILYNFIFNINSIKSDLKEATHFFYEEYSKKKTIYIYKEIKKVFNNFIIEEIEKEL